MPTTDSQGFLAGALEAHIRRPEGVRHARTAPEAPGRAAEYIEEQFRAAGCALPDFQGVLS